MAEKRKTFVILSQVYVPDPASVGQHLHDVAAEMAKRGWRVIVYVSGRGYDDPSVKYPRREVRDGVEIRRIPLASFGKKTILRRVLGTASFMGQVFFRALAVTRPDVMLVSTSPPMIGFIGRLSTWLRSLSGRIPLVYWAMDLNPDQLIAMGKLKETDAAAKFLERNNRRILDRSDLIVALDRFMADRLRPRTKDLDDRLLTIPPWPHEDHVEPVAHEDNPFRAKHDLSGKFVIMYSGNHSPANPLDTLLEAAKRLKDDDRFRFMFVGGGVQKKEVEAFVEQHDLNNAICLPYQPIEDLRFSLSAADVHVVSLGDDMVGIVHPCKVYGAMTVARPVLFFGPKPSHVSDLLDEHGIGKHVSHGDVDGAVATLHALIDTPAEELHTMGTTARKVLKENLSQARLCCIMCDRMEALVPQKK
ncbi:MAG: glycosyltransferase family 4 protein [Planctomycetota bacterium]